MKYEAVPNELFSLNRKKFTSHLEPGSLAILNSNEEFPRSGDQTFVFKQNADLFYLSGIDQEQSILVLFPDSPYPKYREMLFLRETNEHIAVWEGHKYTKAEAASASGIPADQIFWLADFETILPVCMHQAAFVYLNTNENDRYVKNTEDRDLRFIRTLKENYPLHAFRRAAPVLRNLREKKSDLEISLVEKAVSITSDAFKRVLGFVRPGVFEYEIEAEIIHEFIRKRASGHAYSPIIASGEQACVLHYNENNRACREGDLILMDFGAEYANYNSDLTRTIPVSGRFTARQKEVYQAVLHIMKEAKKLLVPGMLLSDYRRETDRIAELEIFGLGLIGENQVSDSSGNLSWFRKFYPHGISHYLGLDVHDVGDRNKKLEPGMILTCEPGIYIREEKLGIRLENDILITATGNIDLMEHVPLELDDIENLMNQDSLFA